MSNQNMSSEKEAKSMQENIKKAGGLFYQYRPCRRNAETIYDIENIRHGVVYAQTPLNMNDPFDSMIGFSSENVYSECISMLVDAISTDEITKALVSTLLQQRAFGKMAEMILAIKELKQYDCPFGILWPADQYFRSTALLKNLSLLSTSFAVCRVQVTDFSPA